VTRAARAASTVGSAAVLAALLFSGPAARGQAQGQALSGAMLFDTCRSCHALDPREGGMAGPNLAGLIGRRVGGDPAYDYSPVLRDANAAGQTWDEALLDRFLTDPEAMFPGFWMSGRGIDDAPERRALVRYIARGGRADDAQ